jgi:U6 snRNA phosphodiesterase
MSPLIDYPDSDDEPDSNNTLPPLPSTFHTLYATSVRTSTSDDPSLHSGRVRQIPHIDGIWPSHLQLEWLPSPLHQISLTNLISHIQILDSGTKLNSLLVSPLGAPAPLHISLSKTLPILSHQRETFLNVLREKVQRVGSRIEVELDGGLHWASNEDKTRCFLIIKPGNTWNKGKGGLFNLLSACNDAVKEAEINAAGLYDDVPAGNGFHFSIAWCLGSGVGQDSTPIPVDILQKAWESEAGRVVAGIVVSFDRIMARIGNTVHAIELPPKPSSTSVTR